MTRETKQTGEDAVVEGERPNASFRLFVFAVFSPLGERRRKKSDLEAVAERRRNAEVLPYTRTRKRTRQKKRRRRRKRHCRRPKKKTTWERSGNGRGDGKGHFYAASTTATAVWWRHLVVAVRKGRAGDVRGPVAFWGFERGRGGGCATSFGSPPVCSFPPPPLPLPGVEALPGA